MKSLRGCAPSRVRGSGPRRGKTPGVVQVQLPATPGCAPRDGYRASARTPRAVLTHVFLDAHCGGSEAALRAARAWRSKQLADAAVPDPPSRRVVLQPKTNSGLVGVYRRPRRHPGTAAWIATYDTGTGKRSARSFSVGKYGEAAARELAVAQRREWELDDLGCALPAIEAAAAEELRRV